MEEDTDMSIVEVKEVVVAAKRLNELAERMKNETYGFKERDVAHIDEIIDALHDLDLHRNRAIDVLETETIKCAAVRHKLMHYPDEINKEIHAAVKAARDMNEDEINGLKAQLQEILDEMKYLDEHSKELDAETVQLTPERDQIKSVFEEAVARLNERLADKAGEQIQLNEDRDSVRVASVNIVDLEEDVVRLREQMVRERADHRDTKQHLAEQTSTTVEKFNEQKARNDEKKQVYTEASAALRQSTKELEYQRMMNKKLDKENADLEALEEETRLRIQRQQQRNEDLRNEIDRIRQLNRSMIEEHKRLMAEMKKSIEEFNEKTKKQLKRRDKCIEQKDDIRDELDAALLVREQDAKKVRELNEVLQEAKNDLATKAEDIGRLQQEIIDMENRRVELADAHRATVLTFNKQIAELKEQLQRERSERMTVQDSNDELQSTIEKFNKEMNAHTRQMNKKITDLKHENVALNDEHTRLVEKIKEDTDRRERLLREIDSSRRDFAEMRDRKEGMVEFLQSDLERLRQERSERSEELDALLPKFKEFEEFFDKTLAEYDALKKTIVALKNRKTGLEESSSRAEKQIGSLSSEIDQLKQDKERKAEQSARQLEEMAEQRVRTEQEIYVLGCKLKTVLEENARLQAGVDRFEAQMRGMRDTWEKSLRAKSRADQQRQRQQQLLRQGWEQDDAMREEFFHEDQRLLVVLAAIVRDTDARKQLVGRVANNLVQELKEMEGFLKTSEAADDASPGEGEAAMVIQDVTDSARTDDAPPVGAAVEEVADSSGLQLPAAPSADEGDNGAEEQDAAAEAVDDDGAGDDEESTESASDRE